MTTTSPISTSDVMWSILDLVFLIVVGHFAVSAIRGCGSDEIQDERETATVSRPSYPEVLAIQQEDSERRAAERERSAREQEEERRREYIALWGNILPPIREFLSYNKHFLYHLADNFDLVIEPYEYYGDIPRFHIVECSEVWEVGGVYRQYLRFATGIFKRDTLLFYVHDEQVMAVHRVVPASHGRAKADIVWPRW